MEALLKLRVRTDSTSTQQQPGSGVVKSKTFTAAAPTGFSAPNLTPSLGGYLLTIDSDERDFMIAAGRHDEAEGPTLDEVAKKYGL